MKETELFEFVGEQRRLKRMTTRRRQDRAGQREKNKTEDREDSKEIISKRKRKPE